MQFTFIVTFTGFPVLSPLKWGRIQTRKFTVRAVDAHRAIDAARRRVANSALRHLVRPAYRVQSV